MQISQALSTGGPLAKVIAFVGGGGKTTSLFRLAAELKQKNKRILIATTTKIFKPKTKQYDRLWIGTPPHTAKPGSIHVWSPRYIKELDKLDSIPSEISHSLQQRFDHILIEADGAKHKPIKAPRSGEPVLPHPCDLVIAVTGWEALCQPINPALVHRWPEFKFLTGAHANQRLSPQQLQPLLEQAKGLFGDTAAQRIWLINKIDDAKALEQAKNLANKIFPLCPSLSGIVLASFQAPEPIHACINRGI